MVFSCFGTKNKAIDLEEQINGAQSDINVQEKRRADLIPNLVDCVQAYDEHEYQTLMDVINARNSDGDYSEEDVKMWKYSVSDYLGKTKKDAERGDTIGFYFDAHLVVQNI